MPRSRNYAAEYQRRIARGVAKGLSRSQARGHPREAEQHVSSKAAREPDRKVLQGLRFLRETGSLSKASHKAKISPERLRRFVRGLDFVEKKRGRYSVGEDRWLRTVVFFSNARRVTTTVRGYEEARRVGLYSVAVDDFLRSNDPGYLSPYEGSRITDSHGRSYTLETRPNVLYRLDAQGGDSLEQIYRIIV